MKTEPMTNDRIKNDIDRTLFEMWCGITVYALSVLAILFILYLVFKDNESIAQKGIDLSIGYTSIGLLIGTVSAYIYAGLLWRSIDGSLMLDPDSATKKMRLNYIFRYTALLCVMVIVAMTGCGSVVTTFIGFMGIKAGAYLNRPMKHISDRIYGSFPEGE